MSQRPTAYTASVNDKDAAQIRELIATIETGFNAKDPMVLDGGFTADAVVTVPDGTVIRGWDALFAYHTGRLANAAADWRIAVAVTEIRPLTPDLAVVLFEQRMTTPDRTFANHGTAVVTRRDGAWWIAALHNTNVAE
ncbi:SgcJ/EcaC family oxidoreductase [Actinomadura kijaniata]|uniref:SgcJ/EcaC family oxidoreductase n=1 Tax=Actinomadura kijaniata TaxID=46161 RepID=UPI00082EF33A|nr:SgcJ/EcaC family oxidoreductase [Actinomadura kijaniata]